MAKKIDYKDLVNQPSFEEGLATLKTMKDYLSSIVALSSKKVSGGVPENTQGLKEYTTAIKASQSAHESLKKIEEQRILLQSHLGKQMAEAKMKNNDLTLSLNAQAKEARATAGSITAMSLELTRLRKEYDNLSPAQRKNLDVGVALLKQINVLDKDLKKLDETVGRHGRKVGDYSGSIQHAVEKLGFLNKYTEIAEKIQAVYNAVIEIATGLFKKKAAAVESETVIEAANTATTEINTTAQVMHNHI
jgi:chromosome segregation ATPase